MGSTVYINKQLADSLRLYNTTGVALVQDEFLVLNGLALVAREAIATSAYGAMEMVKGKMVQAADFDTGEATFATANLAIYWDPSSKKFSNTATIGHYLVGYTIEPIASGVVEFVAIDPVLVPTFAALADVDVAGVTDNDTLKYVASTGKWTDVAV